MPNKQAEINKILGEIERSPDRDYYGNIDGGTAKLKTLAADYRKMRGRCEELEIVAAALYLEHEDAWERLTEKEFGENCGEDGTRNCTLHNLYCGYPDCPKGEREKAMPNNTPTGDLNTEPAAKPLNAEGLTAYFDQMAIDGRVETTVEWLVDMALLVQTEVERRLARTDEVSE